jgi:hypothetical protein
MLCICGEKFNSINKLLYHIYNSEGNHSYDLTDLSTLKAFKNRKKMIDKFIINKIKEYTID